MRQYLKYDLSCKKVRDNNQQRQLSSYNNAVLKCRTILAHLRASAVPNKYQYLRSEVYSKTMVSKFHHNSFFNLNSGFIFL